MTNKYAELPPILNHWLNTHHCYLVGSGAKWMVGECEDPNDYDVIVCENEHFNRMLRALPEAAEVEVNTMGGVKASLSSGDEIDLWPHGLSEYFRQASRKNYESVVAVSLDPCAVVRSQRL